jgi:dGTPase
VAGAGLNLTRATLDATIKYPWGAPPRQAGAEPPKFGYYADDAAAYLWVKQGAPDGQLCLEAQVMDWADDVAYSVHDLEDGLHAGHITVGALHGAAERAAVVELARTKYLPPQAVTRVELEEAFAGLLRLPFWPASFDGGPASLAALKHLTSELIGRFCGSAERATLAAADGRWPLTRYAADLVVPRRQRMECALLKAVTAHFVMSRDGVAARQARQRELIGELAAAVQAGAPGTLDPALRPAYLAADTDAERLRVVVDQIASLTDTSAIAWHDRLCRARRPVPRNRPAGATSAAAAAVRKGPADAR